MTIDTLPQNDSDPIARQEALKQKQSISSYNTGTISGVPIATTVPEEQQPKLAWNLAVLAGAFGVREILEDIVEKQGYTFESPIPELSPAEIGGLVASGDLLSILGYCLPRLSPATPSNRPESIEEYFEFINSLNLPNGFEATITDDEQFADTFLSGINPALIEQYTRFDRDFPVTNAQFRSCPGFEYDSLQSAQFFGRLFIVDLSLLAGREAGEHPRQPKFVYAPKLLLALPRWGGNLQPIAIQTGPDAQYPIVTPADGQNWLMAKLIVKSAEVNHHEIVSHLGLTHLVIEPINLATFRHLADNHPIKTLLTPHFESTATINSLAANVLIARGGSVEKLLGLEFEESHKLVREARDAFNFEEAYLPNDLRRRNVEKGCRLEHYPYRDDALLVWREINRWCRDYVTTFYSSNTDVREDYELQAWCQEISSPDFGRVKGFGTNGTISGREELREILTMIIFTASAQHAAVNFTQAEAALTPVQPLASYSNFDFSQQATEQDVADLLPPVDNAISQSQILTLLGSTYYTQLGQYEEGTFTDPRLEAPLQLFKQRLESAEARIHRRNKNRARPYEHLLPSRIPQSINI